MDKRELFSHFVVCVDLQTGKMWLDPDTMSAHFNGDGIWDETSSTWMSVDDLSAEENKKDTDAGNALHSMIEKHNKEIE